MTGTMMMILALGALVLLALSTIPMGMATYDVSNAIPRQDLAGSLMVGKLGFNPIGILACPAFEVPAVAGRFGKLGIEVGTSRADSRRAPKAAYNRTSFKLKDESYACEEHGLEDTTDDSEVRMYKTYLDYEKVVTGRLRDMLLQEQEYRWEAQFINNTNFPLSGNTGKTVSTPWTTAASATPFADIAAGAKGIHARCGLNPDTLIISWDTWWDLSRCADILDRLKYTGQPGMVMPTAALAQLFGLERVLVGDRRANTARKGQTASLSLVWPNTNAFLCVTAKTNDISEPCVGRTFVWGDDGGQMIAEQYRDEKVRGDAYRVRQSTQEKLLNTECGYQYANIT